MFNFITNLLNINENEIEDLKVLSLPSETQFHITLFPTFPSCPYCGGTVQGHGHTKPKRITVLFLQTKKPLSFSETTGISVMIVEEPFQVKIPLLFPLSKTLFFFSTES